MRGKFMLLDGLDGIGKGVYLDAMKAEAAKQGKKILDLHDYWKQHGKHPSKDHFQEYDLILSSEPTYVGWGKKIREELIRAGTQHSAREIAEAYAADRKELYQQVIIPALQAGIAIIQSRSVTTSLVYQPLDAKRKGESLSIEDVKALEGNAFCLRKEVLPDQIIIPQVSDAKEVIKRLAAREKKDNATFETYEFQLEVKQAFESDWFKNFFEEQGTKVIYADAETSVAFSEQEAARLYHDLFD
jgi:thymidylate kinase